MLLFKSTLRNLFLALLPVMPLSVAAAPVEQLFSASVNAQAPQEQQLRSALAQVMVKVSGRREILDNPAYETVLDNASLLLAPAAEPDRIAFDPLALTKLMNSLDMPVMPEDRPELLVWLVRGNGADASLVEPSAEIYRQLHASAAERGLPMRDPLLDLTDQLALEPSQLAGFATEAVLQASQRYGTDAVLVGHLMESNADWMLLSDASQVSLNSELEPIDLRRMVDQVANSLFGVEEISGGQRSLPLQPVAVDEYLPSGEEIEIQGLNSAAAYLTLSGWLNQQPGVTRVVTAGRTGSGLKLIIELDGTGPSLRSLLVGDSRITELSSGVYSWVGPQVTAPAVEELPSGETEEQLDGTE
ncbi:DUF2066 domain-containing protein [Marinobacterium lutimaris]|uniref:DUF2066 domain-containing protein n=1 Tax=Marinobacterium lutimaris TaxID=568106 RepID=A0A1H5XG79_9GAMM|nr:DUF2066 domain-containing protein [Marinobacterium lutimaris]SEG10709.1 hypothetical protein SAMN05444390_1011376 [Marinobacterium lutimaris]